MKNILCLFLCVLLTGCAPRETPVSTEPSSAAPTIVTAAPETVPPATAAPAVPPDDEELVLVTDFIPGIQVELKYATTDNFTGQVIYDFQDAYLRYGTVKKLAKAQAFFESQGLSLKIWDAYRPVSAQWTLWEAYPDGNFVANPNTTHSSHSRGNTLDVTIVDDSGAELPMPTGFDDFSALADRDHSDCDFLTAENARLLESIMQQNGFQGYRKEWWHFSDTDSYDVIDP